MKLKTSVIVISGCLLIFLFIMLPIFLSTQSKKDDYVASFKGSEFSLKDMNNNVINEKSFNGSLTAIFFWIYELSRCLPNDIKQNGYCFR